MELPLQLLLLTKQTTLPKQLIFCRKIFFFSFQEEECLKQLLKHNMYKEDRGCAAARLQCVTTSVNHGVTPCVHLLKVQ